MTLSYIVGDATKPAPPGNKIIAHICNDIGKWGRGFVMALSKKWPQTRQDYLVWFEGNYPLAFQLGEVQFVQVEPDIWVANMLGQHGIRSRKQSAPPIRYDAVRRGLAKVAMFAQDKNASIHMPRIGTGLAGGKWELIEPIIKAELRELQTFVYDFGGSHDKKLITRKS